MGKASRRKAEARTAAEGRPSRAERRRVRPAGPSDADRVQELLELIVWTDPGLPATMAATLRAGASPASPAGMRLLLVADGDDGKPDAVLTAGPPGEWLQGLRAFGPAAQIHMARRVVDLEGVAVDPGRRGQGLGALLIEDAAHRFRNAGYRLMSGTFELPYGDLTGYYEKRGFTVLPPGKPLLLRIPEDNGAVAYPADPHMQQMWRPLAPGVTAPGGVIDGVL
ncbi:GNAT family N-acetyltransferase [Kitasatospora cineracea]|uniref:GNAT family N-acetyltransferase n=1 Tax=Kitasatospora cineracea TaxID=88074 RepID=UPI003404213A